MAVNYASGLSSYEHKGKCGMKEIFDPEDVVEKAAEQLAKLIADSKEMVVITGAGISTAAGIPDFRGPKGVWTLEERGETPKSDVTFETARPTITHMALVALEQIGKLKHLISQNVDGLHSRSGFPLSRLSELHGNMFVEECDTCKSQFVGAMVVPTMARRHTGSSCRVKKQRGICRGKMRDTILDWEDELPVKELQISEEFCKRSDLCICLGTSLQILPCGNMPLLTRKNGGKVVVINLQKTRLDGKCDLKINAKVDDVMISVCRILGLELPNWQRPIVILRSSQVEEAVPVKPSRRNSAKTLVDDSLVQQDATASVDNKFKISIPGKLKGGSHDEDDGHKKDKCVGGNLTSGWMKDELEGSDISKYEIQSYQGDMEKYTTRKRKQLDGIDDDDDDFKTSKH